MLCRAEPRATMENRLCLGEAFLIPSKMMDKFEISSIHVERS